MVFKKKQPDNKSRSGERAQQGGSGPKERTPGLRPPRFSRWLLARMSIYDAHHTVLEDFEESFHRLASRRGRFRARRWYTGQALRSLPVCFRLVIYNGLALLGNTIKLTLRGLYRSRLFAFINIGGLAVGLAASILVFLFARFETSFDRYHPGAGRIHRIVSETFTCVPYILGDTLGAQSPEIETMARFKEITEWGDLVLFADDNPVLEDSLYTADPSLFQMFVFDFIHGDAEGALGHPRALVLTEGSARRYFNRVDAVGETVLIREIPFQVTAVIQDPPSNTHFHFNLMVSTAALPALTGFSDDDLTSWTSSNYYTYIKLLPKADPKTIETRINTLMRTAQQEAPVLQLQPLVDIHLHSHLRSELEPNGDVRRLRFAAAIGMVILLLAMLNFMNLASARSLHRGREVGLRKVLGARRPQLVRQFIGEALMYSTLAAGLALGLVQAVLPLFRRLTGADLDWSFVPWPNLALFLIASVGITGAAAGAYPAFFASGFQPVKVMRGEAISVSHRVPLRDLLVGIQFLVSILFVFGTLVIWGQMRFIRDKDLGLSGERLVVIDMPRAARSGHAAMREELLSQPGVTAVAASDFLPSSNSQRIGCEWEGRNEAREAYLWKVAVDRNFIPTFGIEMAAGEAFSDRHTTGASYIVNQTAARLIGEGRVDAVIGKTLRQGTWTSRPGPIVGVVRDFHFRSLHHAIEPMVLFLDGSRDVVRPRGDETYRHEPFRYLSAKIAPGALGGTLPRIAEICRRFIPYAPESWFFFDEDFGRLYAAEQRTARFMLTLSLTAVALAAIGLLGLSVYSVERRSKEIGIRRVLGASTSSVLLLFSRDFLRIHALAMGIGFPLVAWMMSSWLNNFAFRIGLGAGLFVATAALTAALFFAAGSLSVYRTAAANPADSLRCE